MIIILELSTGKKIKLTEEEFKEIKGTELKEVYVPYQRSYIEYPYWSNPWSNPIVTCSDSTTGKSKG